MYRRYSKLFHLFLLMADILILTISLSFAILIRFGSFDSFARVTSNDSYIFILIFNVLWIILAESAKVYNKRAIGGRKTIKLLIVVLFQHLFILTFILIVFKFENFSRLVLFYTYTLFAAGVIIMHVVFVIIIRSFPRIDFYINKVIILGAGPVGMELMRFFNSGNSQGYHLLGFFDDKPENTSCKELVIGRIEDVMPYCLNNKVDEIYNALPDHAFDKVTKVMEYAEENLIRFKIVPDFKRYISRNLLVEFFDTIPIFLVRSEPLERMTNMLIKRFFDIVISIIFLITLFPIIYLIIGLFIKISSPGPVFYKQERWGKKNKRFIALKFRSMKYDAKSLDNNGELMQATKDDPRTTVIGRFIRKYNIDEMPQFINVLKGDMSIIGPRPHPSPLNEKYKGKFSKYNVRHLVKPGISGWAQVNGYRGETKDPQTMQKRVDLDIWYIENWTFPLDVLIIFKTLYNMIKGDENAI